MLCERNSRNSNVCYSKMHLTRPLFIVLYTNIYACIYKQSTAICIDCVKLGDRIFKMFLFWLRAGIPRGRISSLRRVKNFYFFISFRRVVLPTQPPIQWVPGALSSGGKVAGVWSWPFICNKCRGQENVDLYIPYVFIILFPSFYIYLPI
jgi:hypothetical protein